MRKLDNDSLMQRNRYGESQLWEYKKGEDMKLHYYESILNFYCDSLTEEELQFYFLWRVYVYLYIIIWN